MTNCGNDRLRTVCDHPGQHFIIKAPQVFHRASATSYNDRIYIGLFKIMDAFDHRLCGTLSLYLCRIEIKLHIGIAAVCHITDILYHRSGLCRDNTDL